MRIALTGNPNSGKTTMYNALTGRSERVGNWAGVTVDKKESPIKKIYWQGAEELIAVDLPGAYSMSPFTSEESITSSYVKNERPDAIINIVDATNLSRSLFFTTQLLELVARNPETAQFVLDYPEVKDDPPGETVGQVTKGTFPLLMQWDSRWGYQTYGDGLMALNGCGPTALSMVICGLTGDDTVTPWTVAQYADQQGYYVDGAGSSWDLMRTGCEHFGLTARELPLDKWVLNAALNKGQPVICSVSPGDFTTSGHFILLTGSICFGFVTCICLFLYRSHQSII